MDMPPAATQGRLVSAVVDRHLDELCAWLDDALSSRQRQRSPYAEERLRDKIRAKTDFLRSLLAAQAECHGGARPVRLAEAEARFAVLEAAFDQWARRAVDAAPEPVEEKEEEVGEPEEEEADCSGSSQSTCSCTDSCQEATEGDAKRDDDVVEARNEEGASDDCIAEDNNAEGETAVNVAKKPEVMGTREEATLDAIAKELDADREAAAETGKRAVKRRWWRQSAAAWCGAAGFVAVVAVGLAAELAALAHHNVNVYVVPT